MIEIKLRVKDSLGKVLAIEIFNQKFGWHHVLIKDAKKYGMEAPIQFGTYPELPGKIFQRVQFDIEGPKVVNIDTFHGNLTM